MTVSRSRPFAFVAVVFALLLSSLTASAAPELPGATEPVQPAHFFSPYSGTFRTGSLLTPMDADVLTETTPLSPTAADVALGQPGLSFRYVRTFGATEEAYLGDFQHLNSPNGLIVDGAGNVLLAEELGARLLVFASTGAGSWSVGKPGMQNQQEYVLAFPKEVARDASGNVWVLDEHRVVQYSNNGVFLQMFPKYADAPWACTDDNGHFCVPRGIAFDSTGRLYVSDTQNDRVQVFSLASGSPVYVATIGVSGVAGSDNTHFNRPSQIVLDSSDRLYVSDFENARVQRCTPSGAGWTCATFHGTGTRGSGSNELNDAFGLGIDESGSIYIADGSNGRIKRCTSAGACSTLISGLNWPADVAADASKNVYVSIRYDFTVRKYSSSGVSLGIFAGTTGVPYAADAVRLNTPRGLKVTSDGSIYTVEMRGYRLVKLNASGAQQWAAGQAGVWGDDNTHFGSWWAGLEGNPIVDAGGTVYVTDTGNDRIQMFSTDGAYLDSFGSSGQGNEQFSCPTGAAINPANSDILIVDHCNHRVQIYVADGGYRTTLGVTGVSGADNTHFSFPWGVAADVSGRIYVADSENLRVQRCVPAGGGYTCSTFAGVTGEGGADFAHLSHPVSVAVDGAGRVYVADEWNSRVQVFDLNGAYLTTLSGSVGSRNGDFRSPTAVAVDGAGNVYVADTENHRIQEFAPGVPGWRQININGFGSPPSDMILSLAPFGGQLYASAMSTGNGGQLWRRDGSGWTAVRADGFGSASNLGIDHLAEFRGQLYAGTRNEDSGGEIWRSADGSSASWSKVVSGGFGDPANAGVFSLLPTTDYLYAGTFNYSETRGAEIWRSSNGNAGSWSRVAANGFNADPGNVGITDMELYNGYIYAGTGNFTTGGEIWRSASGAAGSWQQVNVDGFGRPSSGAVSALAAFNGRLYASLESGSIPGAEVWRCTTCDGADWIRVVENGFGDADTRGVSALEVYRNQLYFVVGNRITGLQVWRSTTGDMGQWEQVGFGGFGDSNNRSPYWDNSVTVAGNGLFVGTINDANGGEVWQLLPNKVYLPLVRRE